MKIKHSFISTFLCAIFLFNISSISAQQKYDIHQAFDETGKFLLKPFHWDKDDLLTAGGVILGTVILTQIDKPVKNFMMQDRSYADRGLMSFGTFYGSAVPHLALGAGLFLHGLIWDNNYTKKFGFELIQALAYTGIVTELLKYTFGRERPSSTDSPFNFSPFSFKGDEDQSLPSGHCTVVFAATAVIASKFENGWIKALCYAPAFITAFSRVYNNRHWVSDTFLGGFVGYFIGSYIVGLHEEKENSGVQISGSLLSISIKL